MASAYDYVYEGSDCLEKQKEQDIYSKPLPWIGVYIAVASLVCTLAMAADLFHGFRLRKFWFPCKYFTLNAASITVIAISMKLPLDLNNPMPRPIDIFTKVSGTAFMCTMLANFMPSLGPMTNSELLANVLALGILVITIAVNLFLQMYTTLLIPWGIIYILSVILVTFMLSLLVIIVSLAITLPNSKRLLEKKYSEMHKSVLDEEFKNFGKSSVDKLTQQVSKYWIMAETSSPQFVIASSPTCSACGAIGLLCSVLVIIASILLRLHTIGQFAYDQFGSRSESSDYKWSVNPIVWIQVVGVVVGTIAPVFRWFSPLTFKLSLKWSKNYLKVYVVEKYWTQRLEDWKHSHVPISFGGHKFKRIVHDVRNLVLNLLIGFQVIVVVVCKTFHLIPIFLVIVVMYLWHCCKWLKRKLLLGKLCSSNNPKGIESNEERVSTKPDISPYVLQLQDQVELSNRTLRSISKAVSRLIRKAEKHQPKNLMKLLEKSTGFEGVAEFDNDQVPLLQYYQELQASNCWSLVVVTLTSIVIALPNIRSTDIFDLISQGVSEGLSYVRLVEESLCFDKTGMRDIIKATRKVWLEVDVYRKWLDINLQENDDTGKTSREILGWLGERANCIVKELENSRNRGSVLDDSTLQKMIAANSMYRIIHTILEDYEYNGYDNDEMLFEKLTVMIADIFGACLSNLPRVITMKCHIDAIEKREESVRGAARILGETKGIMESIFGRFDIPNLNPDQMANIDGWRVALKHQNLSSPVSSSNNESISSTSAELESVVVQHKD